MEKCQTNEASPEKKARFASQLEQGSQEEDSLTPLPQDEHEDEHEHEHEDEDILCSQPSQSFRDWSVEELTQQLRSWGIPEEDITQFRKHEIDGTILSQLTPELVKEKLGIQKLGTQLKIQNFLKSLGLDRFDQLYPHGSKVFNDSVHGHMEFHPLCVAIIDTPQFQRLRYLKQLGACYFVFPGAAHNRFEHSLGVCHLAGKLVRALRKRQPGLGVTDKDVLCVQVAGLCHDLGHGPFSHLFDSKFIPDIRPGRKWKHEEASIQMFDHLVEANDLGPVFDKYHVTPADRVCIKEQICGKPLTPSNSAQASDQCVWHYGENKKFLYEVVANKRNGVDVDKWDYFLRDCHHLGIKTSFDHSRFIKFSRVIRVNHELQICVRDKEAFNMYQMFHTRHALHRKAYQHKVVQAVEIMLVEALKAADNVIRIPGADGTRYKMSECIDHMDAYTNLTDSVFHIILLSEKEDGKIRQAQKILSDIQRRRLYKCVGESVPISTSTVKQSETIKAEIAEAMAQQDEMKDLELDTSMFVVQIANLDFGKKDGENPVNSLRFFSKNNMNNAVPVAADQVSWLLPHLCFKEQIVRVFLRPSGQPEIDDQYRELLLQGFQTWCLRNTMKEPQDFIGITQTPRPSRTVEEDPNITPQRPMQKDTPGRKLKPKTLEY